MANIPVSSSSRALLPQLIQTDDEPDSVEPARRKANSKKASLFPLLSRVKKRSTKKLKQVSTTEGVLNDVSSSSLSHISSSESSPENPPAADEWPPTASAEADVPAIPETDTQIELDGFSAPLEGDSKDVYRWAVVYENQRG